MSDGNKNVELSANGWAAVSRSFKKSLAEVDKNKQAELTVDEAPPPDTDLARKTRAFAKEQLPEKTFNHSMRVWYYGKWSLSHVYSTDVSLYTL
jgi:cyanamide hydratase